MRALRVRQHQQPTARRQTGDHDFQTARNMLVAAFAAYQDALAAGDPERISLTYATLECAHDLYSLGKTLRIAGKSRPRWVALTGRKILATVLLVEDDEALRKLITDELEERGYEVLVARTGEEALDLVRRRVPQPIDLLLTDVAPAGIPGPELASRIRRFVPEVKVVLTSDHAADTVVQDPGTGLLAKPFGLESLMNAIRAVLARN